MSVYENSLQLFANSIHKPNSECESKFLKNLLECGFNKENIKKICVALKKSGAVIAGGGVLSAFKDFMLNDLDIYVNKSQLSIILDLLKELKYFFTDSCRAPAYDLSFFRKNNILLRFLYRSELGLPPIDIMVIPDNIDVKTVVSNFDLSFCEIWFDGENVYSNDPEGINNSEGYLKEDYLDSVFKYFNKFIINRIKKYSKRGFKVSANCNKSDVRISSLLGFFDNEQKTIYAPNGDIAIVHDDNKTVYPEEFVVKFIYNNLFFDLFNTDVELYKNFILTEFKVENLFELLSRFFNIHNGDLWFLNNDVLIHRPEPNDNFIERVGEFLGSLRPEIEKKRINKKIKLLIKYYLLKDNLEYIEEPWLSYFNIVLNKDLSQEEIDSELEEGYEDEKFFINFNSPDIENIDKNMLAEILFRNNLDNFREISYIQTENYVDENGNRRTREILRTEISDMEDYEIKENILNYYININQRKNIDKITSFCIPKDMKIQDMDDFTMSKIPDFLSNDENNFVIIYDSTSTDSFNGFEAVGLNKKSLYQTYNRIIYECKKEYTGAITIDRIKNSEESYLLLGIGTSLNCGLSLNIANKIKDLIDRENERVFYVNDEKLLNNIVSLENLIFNRKYSTNMMATKVNCISGTHCNSETQTNVYQNGYIVDFDSLKNLSDVEDFKNTNNHIIIYDDSPEAQNLFSLSEEDYQKIFSVEHNTYTNNANINEENSFSKIFREMEQYVLVLEYVFMAERLLNEYKIFMDHYERNGFQNLENEYENNNLYKNEVDTLYSGLKLTYNIYIDDKDKELEINNLEREERTKLFNQILTIAVDHEVERYIRLEAEEILQRNISKYSTQQLRDFVNSSQINSYLEENISGEDEEELW